MKPKKWHAALLRYLEVCVRKTILSCSTKQHDAGQASLPRKKKAPSKIIFGKATHENPETPADDYRMKFFEALDLVVNCIED